MGNDIAGIIYAVGREMEQRLERIALAGVWLSAVLLLLTSVLLMHYWPQYKAHTYFNRITYRVDNPLRGALAFLVERQRRTIYELSRSQYIRDLLTYLQGSSEITEYQMHKMESFIKSYQVYFGYKQIFLIDHKGTFVFSTLPSLQNKNIYDPAYEGSSLQDSYILVKMALVSDFSAFTYDPITQQKALFLTMPLFFEEKLNGFLVAQLNDNEIEGPLIKYHDVGKTGKYRIVQQVKDRINFIFPTDEHHAKSIPVRAHITRYSGSPVERVALGYEGYSAHVKDYEDTHVIAAWYFISQLDWGYSCKTDYSEIVRPIYYLGIVGLLLLICALFITLYCIRRRRYLVSRL